MITRNATNRRVIHTGFYSDVAANALSSVLGEESDGYWENSNSHAKYWLFAEIDRSSDGEVLIAVADGYDHHFNVHSWFTGKCDYDIKKYFADRIKFLAKAEFADNGIGNKWTRDCTIDLMYIDCAVNEAYLIYETLKGRSRAAGKYSSEVINKVIGKACAAKVAA